MNRSPKISVITRTYNSYDTVERALHSVLEQSVPTDEYEHVVIDDGSTDGTRDAVREFEEANDSPIRFVPTSHTGPISTLNEGIGRSKGDYVCIVDDDDHIKPQFLEETANVLDERQEIAYAYTDYYEVSTSGERKYIDTSEDLFSTVAAGILFRTQALESVGLYDEDLVFPEYDVLAKLNAEGKRGQHIERPLLVYNRNRDSLTADKERLHRGRKQLNEKYGDEFGFRNY